ncbi:MAG: energy-coupling factor transporter transmembrane component T family protein [Candidatus Odinarchaeota archaeon]
MHIHPLVGLLVVVIQFILLLANDLLLLAIILIVAVLENVICKNSRGAASIMKAILPLVVFFGAVTFLFSDLTRAILVVLRLVIGSLAFSLFFAVTNPSDLARSLEKINVPAKLAILPALALTFVPRVARDAEETIETLALRGEIKGMFLRWMPRILAVFIASVLYRSEFLAQSLYYRGFGIKKRGHYRSVPRGLIDAARLITWLVLAIVFLFWNDLVKTISNIIIG